MTIRPELEAQILRYYHAEKWRPNTIAHQLHVHHTTVQRVLAQAGMPVSSIVSRPSAIDAYVSFIADTLKQFPTLTAARLYGMVCERGYRGSPDHFRHRVALLRPRRVTEAYLRLRTLPGEQGQVDWAHCGHLQIGRARRPLMAFVMVLSYSRRIYLRFFLDARMASFLAGHTGAFAALHGCPRILLYDNLKSAVLERNGDAIRFNPTLLAFAGHHRFEPRPVAVARGNEKGRVERAIRYVRGAFLAARSFTDLADLNAQAAAWCEGPATQRPWPQGPGVSVAQAFEHERALLLALPADAFACHERTAVSIGKTPYARFDLNDYSVPHTHVRRTLTVLADTERVRIADGATVVASHPRSYDRGEQIEDPAHIEHLVEHKRGARQHRATDALIRAVPPIADLLVAAAAHGYNLGSITATLGRIRQQCTINELHAAVLEAIERGVPHPNAVRLALSRRREERGLPAASVVTLPEHLRRRDVIVTPHHLDSYDRLNEQRSDDSTDHTPAL
ncbi:MAG: IS21 family transposase [Gemmatimonadales bacterium]|nr:IS21 family transposase [Gemmatimonadales bacterium]